MRVEVTPGSGRERGVGGGRDEKEGEFGAAGRKELGGAAEKRPTKEKRN